MSATAYYSLRFLGSNAYHERGTLLKTANAVLNLGETADCEVRYEAGAYEPQRYAAIVAEGDGWHIVSRSASVGGRIAGSGGIGYAQPLTDGDVISFDGQDMEVEFRVHHDNLVTVGSGVVVERPASRAPYLAVAALAVVTAVAAVLLALFRPGAQPGFVYDDLKPLLSSVYILKVDSVSWLSVADGDTVALRPTLDLRRGGPTGTAFLTTDGRLATARHCVEYWIGDKIDLEMAVDSLADDDVLKWAILAETYMQQREDGDPVQLLRVSCSVYDELRPDEPVFRFSTTDPNVHVSRAHDGIVPLADFSNDYYWRTVTPYFSNQDMELGDVAYVDVGVKGDIQPADSAVIASLDQSAYVAVLGYPRNSSGKKATFATGSIKENRDTLHSVSPDLLFDANISHGFSGGPLFVRHEGRIVAVGVVSKIDSDTEIFKKAVPITEVGEIAKTEKQYAP